ncbi:aminodeoxychorismate/anthranilate synthase component II [Paenibacillus sp. ClWae2A]|uniref:aminodeoxychorismate/anthranilate synthase component II n=1 Tax=Paenibacillus TaxID=44249 RepID=UPI00096C46C2|nr:MULTISPECIES: aminodeoxychorismate/anthranilate synthase component II [Paenibacillus]MDR6721314.1 para-aminobenzoate synthetase component 2 [Paenibacillus sp. 2003]MDT9723114.1 aminodeoxychorismate/anthranilate synthase component II [Paenibacillus sp. ClWae2A]OME91105.1 anthranilate/aminodeoxychorismate synthase component II [Paenibacillus amylolyticus]
MILVIDNYDSFTYNLVQYLGELGETVEVRRNDEIDLAGIEALAPDHILISPGPCTPNEAGISLAVINHFKGSIPIFGVCLGHQSIGQAFGGNVIRAERMMHGKTSEMHHNGTSVFAGLPSPFTATRYHSLIVERSSLPDCLEITAETAEGEIMGLRHKEYAIEGVQFHPESIITDHGHQMLRNFLSQQVKV